MAHSIYDALLSQYVNESHIRKGESNQRKKAALISDEALADIITSVKGGKATSLRSRDQGGQQATTKDDLNKDSVDS